MMGLNLNKQISLAAFGELLELLSFVLLPKPNSLPSSVYLLHKILGIDLNKFEEHVCINDCCHFPQIHRSEWADHLQEKCDDCNSPRFIRRSTSIAPQKKFFRIPISFQIQNLLKNKRFRDSIQKMAEQLELGVEPTESFWGSEIVAELVENEEFLTEFSEVSSSLLYL